MAKRLFPERPYTSRKLTDPELKVRLQEGCPCCNNKIVSIPRIVRDKRTGKEKFGGTFLACSAFGKGCDAHYSLSIDTNIESFYS